MTATPATSQYLKTYISERLPALEQGAIDFFGDPQAFSVDQRYIPLQDPVYQG